MLRRVIPLTCRRQASSTSLVVTDRSELVLERLTGDMEGVAVIGFNRPKALNSLSKNLLALFLEAVNEVKVCQMINRNELELYYCISYIVR